VEHAPIIQMVYPLLISHPPQRCDWQDGINHPYFLMAN
jgi:hypothetical protein